MRTFGDMRLRVPELLKEHGITAYELAKRSGGRISLTAAYRLAGNRFRSVPLPTLDALCDVFGIKDPGPLFEREKPKRGAKRAATAAEGQT